MSAVIEAGASFHKSISLSGMVSKSFDPARQVISNSSATAPAELDGSDNLRIYRSTCEKVFCTYAYFPSAEQV